MSSPNMQQPTVIASVDTTDSDGDDDGLAQFVLSNPLVLHQIFAHLPTKHLLKTCCLVNKTWNVQAKTFIRDRRECEVVLCTRGDEGTCPTCCRLEKLADILSGASVIPINSISYMNATGFRSVPNCRFSKIEKFETIRRIKLRRLTITMADFRFHCASQTLIAQMLRENSKSLQTLTFRGISPVLEELLRDWVPQLPKLESLHICSLEPERDVKYKDFYGKLILGAPNLKIVFPGKVNPWKTLCILPDTKYYKLLGQLNLEIDSVEREKICRQIAKASPKLQTLNLEYRERDSMFFPSFCNILQQVLHNSRKSLETVQLIFENNIGHVFETLDWPKLERVQKFTFVTLGSSRELLSAITRSIDYGRVLPALEIVKFGRDPTTEDDDGIEEQEFHPSQAAVCQTVSKLDVHLPLSTALSFIQLKTTFPAVLRLTVTGFEANYWPPLEQIFQLWPKLERLELLGGALVSCPNHDAEFCGISKEEMSTYYAKDNEFLRALHLVPSRPCISTMLNLKHLTVKSYDCAMGSEAGISEPEQMFLSKAAYLLVFQRQPQLELKISFQDLIRLDDSHAGNGNAGGGLNHAGQ